MKAVSLLSSAAYATGRLPYAAKSSSMQIGPYRPFRYRYFASCTAVAMGWTVTPATGTCSTITLFSPSAFRSTSRSLMRFAWAKSSVTMKSVRRSLRMVSVIFFVNSALYPGTSDTSAPTIFRP